MNWDQIEGRWKQVKGKAQSRWGQLTDDDLDKIGGKREELIGRLQARYGGEREELERQVEDWTRELN